MTTAQIIMEHLRSLPDEAQREVLNFIEFIESRRQRVCESKGDYEAWSALSITSAMRGMENEESPYTTADLKEIFL